MLLYAGERIAADILAFKSKQLKYTLRGKCHGSRVELSSTTFAPFILPWVVQLAHSELRRESFIFL